MSSNAAPSPVHSGILVQSRLPLVLHRVLPAGTLSLQNIGMVEAAIIGSLIYAYGMARPDRLMQSSEYLIAGGVGAGLYMMAPP